MRSHSRKSFSEINITPLTDIFLVLLIIMMVVSPLLEYKGINVAISSGAKQATEEEPKAIVLSIDANGTVSVDKQPADWATLAAMLETERQAKPDGIVIETDPETLHDDMARALGAAQAAGIQKVVLREKAPESETPPATPAAAPAPSKKK